MSSLQNLLSNIPSQLPHELTQALLATKHLRIERIVSLGHASPPGFWYDQETDEWVLLFSGQARLRFDDGEMIEMTAGSYVNIAAHRKHRVDWTDPSQPTVWLAVHYRV
jgi:cupin 2 domain-containing protein